MSDAATETLRVPIIGTAPFVLAPARNHPTTQQGSTTMATASTPKPENTGPAIEISRIGTETLLVPVVGTSPLITHKFSEKAKRQMLDAMQGNRTPKQPKDPQAEFEAAAYRLDDGGYGAPAIAFKSATVSAARFFGKEVSMVGLRQTLFFGGEFSKAEGQLMVRIEGSEPTMREDVVRVGNGGTDLRYRPFFAEWSATLEVTYVASMLTRASVLSLIEAGGLGVGVGEWRPEKKGDMGTYQIDPSREVEVK
jgi:hypothetical protein